MKLVVPSPLYKKSFLEALREYQREEISERDIRHDLVPLYPNVLAKSFETYIKQIVDASKGKYLPKGFVAHTTYWLVDCNEFIGRVDIRHTLTDKLLREGGHIGYDIRSSKRKMGYGKKLLALALPKAKALGITKALITCDESNIGSKKIIEANGGVFENSVDMGEGCPRKLRYWIQR
ncbi:MAG TPA: GNAT family N-acetyltransferase [Candidatus Saccharimonadales bacterium]|nr:GNAT family N-acetyltransferase [Candidatus Saccharimonadales bacterium]